MQQTYWTKEKEDFLIKNREKLTLDELTKALGFKSTTSITKKIKGLSLPKKSIRKGNLEKLLDDTPESFYWLGFITADGYISKEGHLQVITHNNIEHLGYLATFLGTTVTKHSKSKTAYPSKSENNFFYRVAIKDLNLGVQLRDLMKIKAQKTYDPISMDFIKEDWQFICFLIGLIDGDGNINKDRGWRIKIELYHSWMENLIIIKNWIFRLTEYESNCKINQRGYAQLIATNMTLNLLLLLKVKEYNLPTLKVKI